MVNVVSSSRYRINRKMVREFCQSLYGDLEIPPQYSINVVFVGRNRMKGLALNYKKENEALPVLSFQYNEKSDGGEILLGEVIICYPQAVLLAAERNRKVDETLKSLIRHGVENLLK